MKMLVVGQAPSSFDKDCKPWSSGNSSKRLWKWFGCKSYEEFSKIAVPYYACPWLEGKNKKGDAVPKDKQTLKQLSRRLEKEVERYNVVCLVGKFAQNLLFSNAFETIDKIVVNNQLFVILPHPSGVNVLANHKDLEIINYLKEIIDE